jgi:predicted transcriptional regulator
LGTLAIIEGHTSAVRLERAIVLELLDEEGERGRSCAELAEALGCSEAEVAAAVERLREAGVLQTSAQGVLAAPAVLRLDELGLLGI